MNKLLLVALMLTLLFLTACEKSNGIGYLSKEECECREGDYLETGKSLVGKTMVTNYNCFKDGEEIYRTFSSETCEKYWELKNEKRYKWSK